MIFEAQPGIGLSLRKEILLRRGVFADPAVRPPAKRAPESLLELVPQHLAAVPHAAHTTTSDRTA